MSDISQVSFGSKLYNIKNKVARQRMIDNITNSDVNAIINFVNGIKANGQNVISQATADIVVISADSERNIDLTISQDEVTHFSFRIPKVKILAYYGNNDLFRRSS